MNNQVQQLPFNQDWIVQFSEQRTEILTTVFQFFSELGNIEGYLVIIALLFTVINKRLGVYSAMVALFAILLNHLLKITIKNPRPFVLSHEYVQEWGVSVERMAELINEYSTPSGHAMTSAAFFGFLFFRIKNYFVRFFLLLTILGIGIARPYLGVHFVEDVMLGWLLGFALAYLAHKKIDVLWEYWAGLGFVKQLLVVMFTVLILLFLNNVIDPKPLSQFPLPFISILGFFSGTLLAASYEQNHVGFSLATNGHMKQGARFALMLTVLIAFLVGLDYLFARIASDFSPLGLFLRYLRYFLVSLAGLLFVPYLFLRFNLAQKTD